MKMFLRKYKQQGQTKQHERGATMVEMAIGGTVFFLAVFGVFEFARIFFTYNALTDAARNGARYAAMYTRGASSTPGPAQVRNMVVYGSATPASNARPIVNNLTTANVSVVYSADYGVKSGNVTVQIQNYSVNMNIPLFGATWTVPVTTGTSSGEAAGYLPSDISY